MIVDLFAGLGGWDYGAKMLGLDEPVGLELDPHACASRRTNGLLTLEGDLTTVDPALFAHGAEILLGSPPCQTFSRIGNREGRDSARGALVDEPLRWIEAIRPRAVALEQVPDVLPIWKIQARRLEEARLPDGRLDRERGRLRSPSDEGASDPPQLPRRSDSDPGSDSPRDRARAGTLRIRPGAVAVDELGPRPVGPVEDVPGRDGVVRCPQAGRPSEAAEHERTLVHDPSMEERSSLLGGRAREPGADLAGGAPRVADVPGRRRGSRFAHSTGEADRERGPSSVGRGSPRGARPMKNVLTRPDDGRRGPGPPLRNTRRRKDPL